MSGGPRVHLGLSLWQTLTAESHERAEVSIGSRRSYLDGDETRLYVMTTAFGRVGDLTVTPCEISS